MGEGIGGAKTSEGRKSGRADGGCGLQLEACSSDQSPTPGRLEGR